MRLAEARALRRIVAEKLTANPKANVLVVGDMNDRPNAAPIRELIGRRKPRLVDLRPFERREQGLGAGPRRVTWTSFFRTEDSFSRFDYILASGGMAREMDRRGTYVHAMAGWGLASDHRPVVARFMAEDR